jgi:prepilin-type N-terminal cleavage/methylation domain-containing protein
MKIPFPTFLHFRLAPSLRNAGFTLLEVMIAMAIMTVAFASILVIQSSSLNTSLKAKQQNVVSMLARNALTQTEVLLSGKSFSEVPTELVGQFEDPFQDYSWERKIKEVKFPNLQALLSPEGGGEDGKSGDGAEGRNDVSTEMMGKLVTTYLSKALREITITVKWKKGKGEQSYSVGMYWVDFETPFQLTP